MAAKNSREPIKPFRRSRRRCGIVHAAVGSRLFVGILARKPQVAYYMDTWRLQKSGNLPITTDHALINVALACGFASPFPFLKVLPCTL